MLWQILDLRDRRDFHSSDARSRNSSSDVKRRVEIVIDQEGAGQLLAGLRERDRPDFWLTAKSDEMKEHIRRH